MKTATFIRNVENFPAHQSLYRLDPPHEGHEHVVVSSVVATLSGPETLIFPADANGKIQSFSELPGSCRGTLDHIEALNLAGYEV